MLWWFFAFIACVRHSVGPAATPESCQAGDLAACRTLAAAAADLPTGTSLDQWACDQGHAPSCAALATAAPRDDAAAALAAFTQGCTLGDADACLRGADRLADAPAPLESGALATAACALAPTRTGRDRRSADTACALLREWGWQGEEVRGVRVLDRVYTAHAVLPGGTVVTVMGDGVSVYRSTGRTRVVMKPEEGKLDPGNVRRVVLTADRRLLALLYDPPAVWSMLDGTVTRLDAWEPDTDIQAQIDLADDGSTAAFRLRGEAGIAVWALPGGAALGFLPRPAERGAFGVRVGRDGRLALVFEGRQMRWRPADLVSGAVGEPRTDAWDGWLHGVDLPAGTPMRATVSPDGTRVAVPTEQGVSIRRPDGVELAYVRLPELPDHALVYRLHWSADGGRLMVPLAGAAAVISMRGAVGDEADDTPILRGIQPLPLLPAPGASTTADVPVTGRVTLAGAPVAGAEVYAEPCRPGSGERGGRTLADGTFTLSALPRGCWRFRATGAAGLPSDRVDVSVAAGTEVALALTPVADASGVVLDAAGHPAAGVSVRGRWRKRSGGGGTRLGVHAVVAETRTDARGRFTLRRVPAEGIDVEAVRLGEAALAEWTKLDHPAELRLRPALIVRTRLDSAALNARVEVRQGGQRIVSEPLLPDGTWVATDLPVGTPLEVRITQGNARGDTIPVTLPVPDEVRLPAPALGRLHVVTGGRFEAQVWLEHNWACREALDGCRSDVIPAGPLKVYAFSERVGAAVIPVDVRRGETETVVTVAPDARAATVSGRVVDAQRRPVPGVVVSIPAGRRADHVRMTTGPDGRFRLSGVLSPGVLAPFDSDPRVLRLEAPRFAPVELPIEVHDAEAIDVGVVTLGAVAGP